MLEKSINKRGITLIALTITIIVLLILAGIVITLIMNNNIFEKANEANFKTKISTYKENQALRDSTRFQIVKDNMSFRIENRKKILGFQLDFNSINTTPAMSPHKFPIISDQ